MSHKSGTIGELCCLATYGRIWRLKSCCKSCVYNLECLPRTRCYDATHFAAKCYCDVATLTWEFARPTFLVCVLPSSSRWWTQYAPLTIFWAEVQTYEQNENTFWVVEKKGFSLFLSVQCCFLSRHFGYVTLSVQLIKCLQMNFTHSIRKTKQTGSNHVIMGMRIRS
jgi:hypothetical protein